MKDESASSGQTSAEKPEAAGAGVAELTPFARMADGRWAQYQAEERLEAILGVELVGVGFDDYDSSFEIYPMPEAGDVIVTDEMHAQILALGCSRYWINFSDDTERYCQSPRKAGHKGQWERFDKGAEARRSCLGCSPAASGCVPRDAQ